MSKNLTQLARRKGIEDTLFQRLIVSDKSSKSLSDEQRKSAAKEFLIGEAVVKGTASFYDFIDGKNANKKAYICDGSSCLCAGTQTKVLQQLTNQFGEDQVGHVTCLGRCFENSAFQLSGENFSGNDIDNLSEIVKDKTSKSNEEYQVKTSLTTPILTAEIDNVNQYYQQFANLLVQYSADELLVKIADSGLRGRGGAGFPTGFKWQSCRDVISDEKYIVCNADEGDAGAFSDRYLLEQRPHAVLYGMLVAGYLVGASTGVLYIRDEYPAAIDIVEQAIAEFAQLTAIKDVFEFSFKIIRGAGAYICGEETALLRSIEGQRPVVSVRPPFPTQSGLFGCPTVLNNVETFASIHYILSENGQDFKNMGNGKSTGSKLISLDSSFINPGIYEVAMGTSLDSVFELAGGFSKPLKALQIGGPLGGVVPLDKVSQLTVDFESFAQAGFLLGHASIIGIPSHTKMIEYIAHLFEFTAAESCGKCYPCSLGSVRGHELVKNAILGKQLIDRELLNDLLETMQLGSLCALGGGVPLPIQNILQYFDDEIRQYCQSPSSVKEPANV